jgi:hypothetical protein
MFQSSITFFVALNPITTKAPKETGRCLSSFRLKAIKIDKINIAETMALSIVLL